MSESILIIGNSLIHEGKHEELKSAMDEYVEFVKANEPQIIAFNVYLNTEGTQVTVLQLHPNSESAEFHTKIAGPFFSRFLDLITMSGLYIYGNPSPSLLKQIQDIKLTSSATVVVNEIHAGFERF